MKNLSRKHHYVSEFYLNGFASRNTGEKTKKITVINNNQNCFRTTAKNLAHVRDFNRINIPDMKADAIEKVLSDFETKAAKAILEIHQTNKFEGENRLIILELIAMFTSRNPNRRENTRDFMTEVLKKSSALMMNHDSKYRKMAEELATILGTKDSRKMSAQELNSYIHEKTKLELTTEYHLHTESIFITSIFNALIHRTWALVQTSEETGPIITSDNPAVLCWNDPESIPVFLRQSPGYGMKSTTLYFSLSQHLALIGTFEGTDTLTPPNQNLVAVINTMHLIHANNQIYAPNLGFQFFTKDKGIQEGKILPANAQSAKRK